MKIFGFNLRLRKKELPLNVVDNATVEETISNPDFPFLVSFSRTGSHWLRILTETYFDVPSMKLIFHERNYHKKEFLYFHTHDMDLSTERKNVIYLYRNPVPTVFSQMKYYKIPLSDRQEIERWSRLYARHLNKWLFLEDFTSEKLILTYEELKNNPEDQFKSLCGFFGKDFNKGQLEKALSFGTKDNIKAQTKHDIQVINSNSEYSDLRERFESDNSEFIFGVLKDVNPQLINVFKK